MPDSAILATESDALLVTERVAPKVPAALGVKLMFTVTLCPAATVIGKAGPVSEKYLVEMLKLLMVIEVDPEFVAVVERLLVVPALTPPKSRDATANNKVPLCC